MSLVLIDMAMVPVLDPSGTGGAVRKLLRTSIRSLLRATVGSGLRRSLRVVVSNRRVNNTRQMAHVCHPFF